MSNKTNTEIVFFMGAVVVGVALVLGINSLIGGMLKGAPADMSEEAVAARIAPTAKLNTGAAIEPEAPAAATAPAAAPAAAGGTRSGQEIYQSTCFACHGTGAAGAPKLGDAAAWAPRIASGMDALMNSAINGKNAMPPRGTCGNCSDDDLKAAVEHMVNNSK